MFSENSSLPQSPGCTSKVIRFSALGCFTFSGIIFFILSIVLALFPLNPIIQKWYLPIPQAINSIITDAHVVYPTIKDIQMLSKTVIRGDVFFQFGFEEFNKTLTFGSVIIDNQIDPILNLTDSTISGMTDFVNGIADFLHKFHINFNLTFVKNLNTMNDILQQVPSQLSQMQVQMDKASIAGAALGQAVDIIGMRFDKFHSVCENLTLVVDDVFTHVDIIMNQLDQLDRSIPAIVIITKVVGCFLFAWLSFISIILFIFIL
ncbi:hypothetical protein EDI_013510 [Entamoeba dispar SAW760]|uniref:Uncharacterized protein n=1 Tax=Entamoeba dispar (strain ATCC PRA-260 / SAW760) TaxID=370354 RepID=B0E5P5_ENTDS|nr:uncharacterized protein EDI_013510 [Entamoeba dispar SAW760]EDR30141.1 hypothetical protein EDI_013510 [Entamoeba dispar SAW760]|eukprot:EDR30141.1 hypothetical protein EDI_013510 [Entamoeba dispar SAW760]